MSAEPEYCDTCGVQFSYFGINCNCHLTEIEEN